MKKRQVVVIGLGRFGSALLRELNDLGHEVLGVDLTMPPVEDAAEHATQAVQADATDEDILRQLGVGDFDAAVVGIGSDVKSSILVTMNLKKLDVPLVVCKAQDQRHGAILAMLGADRVVYPESETASRLAHALVASLSQTDYMEISPSYGIAKVSVPPSMVGQTLGQIDLRGRFSVNVLLLRSGGAVTLNPSQSERLKAGDVLVVAGDEAKLEAMRGL